MKKWLVSILVLAVLAASGGLIWEARTAYKGFPGSALVTIPAGSSASEAAAILAARGVIHHRAPFLTLYALGRSRRRTLKAGEYLFDRPLRPREVYWKIVRGEVYYHLVVIPEGSDRFDMARIFHDKLSLDPDSFLRATEQTKLIRDLDPDAPTLEGYLFPDTYRFPASTTPTLAVETMVARFRHVFTSSFRSELDGQSLHDVITLASLVEKETPSPAERPEIAGVLERRLQRGMLLQCDPTVTYAARLATDPESAVMAAPSTITASELDSPSPYNTYRHAGLPPGPICSPGAASIEAALHPSGGDALYFVSNLHGGHVFASTLAEHNRNVARYRREAALVASGQSNSQPRPKH